MSDSFVVKWSIRSYLEELLAAGVKVYFYQKGFLHSKVIVADDAVASIGTANLDIRSFEQNLEINALLYDAAIARQLKAQFFTDLQDSVPLVLDKYRQRPRWDRAKESVFRVLSPVLWSKSVSFLNNIFLSLKSQLSYAKQTILTFWNAFFFEWIYTKGV